MLKVPPAATDQIPTLQVIEGPGVGSLRRFQPNEPSSLTVGRTTDAQFVIDHPTVSRCHARFTWAPVGGAAFQMLLEDLESTNGVTVNGQVFTSGCLKDADHIALGSVVLRFQLLSPGELRERDRLTAKATVADVDALTTLGTRAYMEDQLPRLLAECDSRGLALSLLILDLDHFKRVNDTYGHQAGDVVLQEVGRCVMGQIRGSDVAIRYGGEELLVLLPGSPQEGARHVAERLRRAVEAVDVTRISPSLKLSVSIGAAQRHEGEPFDSLLRRADGALYRAKTAGRNRIEYDTAT